MVNEQKDTPAAAILTTAEAAEVLGISLTSLKNWERHGYLSKTGTGFRSSDIDRIIRKIENGELNRLNSRANKKRKTERLRPSSGFTAVCEILSGLDIPVEEIMLLLAVRLFTAKKEISGVPVDRLFKWDCRDFRREAVRKVLEKRSSEIAAAPNQKAYKIIMEQELPETHPSDTDIMGAVYQGLRSGGRRSESGSFYTPPETAADLIRSALNAESEKGISADRVRMVDPCCGSGQFILSFIAAGGNPENTCGMDSDPTAGFCAAVNILLQCPDFDAVPSIRICDSLLPRPDDDVFDMAVTNPPWGAVTGSRQMLQDSWPSISSGESFSCFICRCFSLVREGGIVSAVLPESVTNVKRHKDIREYIISNSRIRNITERGNLFRDVFTPVITIEMEKTKGGDGTAGTEGFRCTGPDLNFNINLGGRAGRIIDHIYNRPHVTLKGKADWALGIVTGDNARYLVEDVTAGTEAVIRGRDVTREGIKTPEMRIRFKPEQFQQTAPEWKYRQRPKLVYKFISKKLVFAVDNSGTLTLNSANIILPDQELVKAGFDCIQIADTFNSDIWNFIYQRMFNSVKVLRGNLEQLPLIKKETLELPPDDLEYIRSAIE